jgi:hypothetical protein
MINEDLGPSRQLQVLHLRVINDDALNFFLNIHLARLLPDLIGIFDIDWFSSHLNRLVKAIMCGENLQIKDLWVVNVAEIDFISWAHVEVLVRNMMVEGLFIVDPGLVSANGWAWLMYLVGIFLNSFNLLLFSPTLRREPLILLYCHGLSDGYHGLVPCQPLAFLLLLVIEADPALHTAHLTKLVLLHPRMRHVPLQ